MCKFDDDYKAIDHDDLYELDLDDDRVDDLESVIHDSSSLTNKNMVRIRFNASLNGYLVGDEVTVSFDNEFFAGLIRQKLVEVL